jgi:type II secretory pathway predicted ATPase ExeA
LLLEQLGILPIWNRAEHVIFTEEVISRIYEYSAGIPRVISKVCTNVMTYGAQNRFQLIDDHAVATAQK